MSDPAPISATVEMRASPEAVWKVVRCEPGRAEGHDAELADGIRTTLERIRSEVETVPSQ